MAVTKAIRITSRAGWRDYYIARYNKTGLETSAHLAMWYMLLELAEL